MKDILTVIEEVGVDLKKISDRSYRGFCPFHEDSKTPNFTVYEDTDSWYCFRCGFGGNAVNFVQRYYNIIKRTGRVPICSRSNM